MESAMNNWDRRSVLTGLGSLGASVWLAPSADALGLADDKVKIVRYFSNAGDSTGRRGQPMVNQSTNVVMIETEGGLVGIGEGGEPTTMNECASMLIGQDPFRVDQHWQRMLRGYFYPAGREKTHSLGALDMALWDLKAKALEVPLWQLLGGKSRDHLELYATAFPRGPNGTLEDAARACMDAGFRCYRHATDNPRERLVDRFKLVRQMHEDCIALHKIPFRMPRREVIWLADRHWLMLAMIGMPPATEASKAIERPNWRAQSKSSGPCSASKALFAVTTSLPLSSSRSIIERAGSSPPINWATTLISGLSVIRRKSSDRMPGGSWQSRRREGSRTTTSANSNVRPACLAIREPCSKRMRASPDPTVPNPTMATFVDSTEVPTGWQRTEAASSGEESAIVDLRQVYRQAPTPGGPRNGFALE
jgi:hypothetical protein